MQTWHTGGHNPFQPVPAQLQCYGAFQPLVRSFFDVHRCFASQEKWSVRVSIIERSLLYKKPAATVHEYNFSPWMKEIYHHLNAIRRRRQDLNCEFNKCPSEVIQALEEAVTRCIISAQKNKKFWHSDSETLTFNRGDGISETMEANCWWMMHWGRKLDFESVRYQRQMQWLLIDRGNRGLFVVKLIVCVSPSVLLDKQNNLYLASWYSWRLYGSSLDFSSEISLLKYAEHR